MEKLQLYISKSLRGYKTLTNINGTESSKRQLRELRQALETVAYDSAEKCVFFLIRYAEGATFFSILRTIPDKTLDHLEATIVIPYGTMISADELYRIIREITRKVSNPGMNADDISQLRNILDKPYPLDPDSLRHAASTGHSFACMSYGGDTGRSLKSFLGENLYQSAFTAYAGVLLVDASLPFTPKGPEPTEHAENHKSITPASFFVTSRISNQQLPKVSINVNGVEINGKHTFTENELQNAHVRISAPGYQTYDGHIDLASATQALIELDDNNSTKRNTLLEEAEADTNSKINEALADNGFNADSDYNENGMQWWKKVLLMLGGVAVALTICALLFPELWQSEATEPDTTADETVLADSTPAASIAAMKMEAEPTYAGTAAGANSTVATSDVHQEKQSPAVDTKAAAAFIDGNTSKGWWTKADADRFPELDGLYDDLNNYNFDALINNWPKKIPESSWLKTIADHAKQAKAKKIEPKSGNHNPQYSRNGKIHRREYINWINRRQG